MVWRRLGRWLKSEGTRYVKNVGVFAIALALVGYWISYQDRIATRQNTAWDNLRSAMGWVESGGHWGNAGQIAAIETLTHDCGRWWRNTFLQPVFELIYHDCVDLKSLTLKNMELGSLQAAGANFSYGDLSCANFAQANLRNADLRGTDLGGSNLAGADLRGALLTTENAEGGGDDANLWITDMSWVLIDSSTRVNFAKLKCACIQITKDNDGIPHPHTDDQHVTSPRMLATLRRLNPCPSSKQSKCDPEIRKQWACVP